MIYDEYDPNGEVFLSSSQCMIGIIVPRSSFIEFFSERAAKIQSDRFANYHIFIVLKLCNKKRSFIYSDSL